MDTGLAGNTCSARTCSGSAASAQPSWERARKRRSACTDHSQACRPASTRTICRNALSGLAIMNARGNGSSRKGSAADDAGDARRLTKFQAYHYSASSQRHRHTSLRVHALRRVNARRRCTVACARGSSARRNGARRHTVCHGFARTNGARWHTGFALEMIAFCGSASRNGARRHTGFALQMIACGGS